MNKPNYEHKAKIIASGLDTQYSRVKKSLFFMEMGLYNKYTMSIEEIEKFYSDISEEDLKECERINHNKYAQYTRLKKRVSLMMLSPCCFVTFTFNNETLESTSKETRKKYIKRYLNSLACHYVANIDYGKKNEREHYHALITLEEVSKEKLEEYYSKYGALKVERIRNGSYDLCVKKVSKYIVKLTKHAIKNTTRNNLVIYDRLPWDANTLETYKIFEEQDNEEYLIKREREFKNHELYLKLKYEREQREKEEEERRKKEEDLPY